MDLTKMDVQGLYRMKREAGVSSRPVHCVHVTLQKTFKQARGIIVKSRDA